MKNRFGNGATVEPHAAADAIDNRESPSGKLLALWQRVERMVADHPKQSLIAALAAGAVLGWFTKRR